MTTINDRSNKSARTPSGTIGILIVSFSRSLGGQNASPYLLIDEIGTRKQRIGQSSLCVIVSARQCTTLLTCMCCGCVCGSFYGDLAKKAFFPAIQRGGGIIVLVGVFSCSGRRVAHKLSGLLRATKKVPRRCSTNPIPILLFSKPTTCKLLL